MRHLGLLFGIGALVATSNAFAQTDLTHPTIRVDNALAVPLGDPQDHYFGPGGLAALKLAFNLTPWLDVDPSVETIQLSQQGTGTTVSGVGGTWAFGLGARVKRPHNVDDNSYWGVVSPWIGADYQYYNTGGLGRMGGQVEVGISTPLDYNRHWWLGPVVGYSQITDGTSVGGTSGRDTRDSRVGWLGLELEFDTVGYKHPAAPVVAVYQPPTTPVVEEKKPVVAPPPVVHQDTVEVIAQGDITVQFDFDSAALAAYSKSNLDVAAAAIQQHLTAVDGDPLQRKFKSVEVDGYASSEHHPWAEKHNQTLSEERAQAVVDYLISKGVPGNVISAKGFGTSNPVASNDTEEGRVANRRVEFQLTISFIRTTQEGGQ